MTSLRAALVAAFLLAGCGCDDKWDFNPMPRQADAVKLVWTGLYGNTKEPPTTVWRHQRTLDCGVINGKYVGFLRGDMPWGPRVLDDAHCVYGVTWDPAYISQIAAGDGFSFADSAWPHEMYHATLQNDNGDGDPNHLDEGWQPGGIVDQARKLLGDNDL